MSEILEQQPVLLWDSGQAKYPISMDKHGQLYRTPVQFLVKKHIGVPGKVYTVWSDWYRDFLRLYLKVRTCSIPGMDLCEFARFKYNHYLKSIENNTDERSAIEREIIQELLVELEKP